MLSYDHVFNTDVDQPFHIHAIASSSTSVAINLNGVFVGYFKPNLGSTYTFIKYTAAFSILDLMVVGTRQEYDKATSKSFFKDSVVKYIQNSFGDFLVRDNELNTYSWSSTARTRFFFNPEYFNSKVLWNYIVGYVPTGKIVTKVWSDYEALTLFTNQIYITDETWTGDKAIPDVEPLAFLPFSNETMGIARDIVVDSFIEELQGLKDGDIITIDNGTETIEVTVENCYTNALYNPATETTRPLVHVPIDIINPNKKYLYTKGLDVGDEETINLELHGNNIQFNIKRI